MEIIIKILTLGFEYKERVNISLGAASVFANGCGVQLIFEECSYLNCLERTVVKCCIYFIRVKDSVFSVNMLHAPLNNSEASFHL